MKRRIKRRRTHRSHTLWRWLFACVTALFILSPMLFLELDDSSPDPQTGKALDAMVISLPPRPPEDAAPELATVYDWLSIADPTIFILPDVNMGFARFRAMPKHEFRTALPSNVQEPEAPTMPELHATPLPIRESSLSLLLTERWPSDTALTIAPLPQWQPPSGIFWRDLRGRMVIDPPIIQPDFIGQAIKDHGPPQQLTLLEIEQTPLLPMPRAVIRQSCGNAKLDELLLNAVRDYFQRRPFTPATVGPRRARKLLLEVDWRLPAARS
ncbi:MAG: hypothetical protein ACOX9E_03650 [Lentisphaeria bacterium]|jgi:hypothetical protein